MRSHESELPVPLSELPASASVMAPFTVTRLRAPGPPGRRAGPARRATVAISESWTLACQREPQ